jgi:hypothetical protein
MLTDAEIERKFHECNMPAALEGCEQRRVDHDPAIASIYPYSSVVQKREHGISYKTPTGVFVALIFYFKSPDGEERMSIRMFVCPVCGHIYRLKQRDLRL